MPFSPLKCSSCSARTTWSVRSFAFFATPEIDVETTTLPSFIEVFSASAAPGALFIAASITEA